MSALALGLVAALAWGFHDICVRKLSQSVPLLAALLSVLVVGLIFQTGLTAATTGFAPLPVEVIALSLASGVCFLVASLGLYGAFQRGPVRLVAPIIASYPVLSVGWAALNGVTVGAAEWLAVGLIVAGVATVAALADEDRADVPPKARTILYALVASIGFAGTFALGQRAAETAGEMPVTVVARIAAVLALIAVIALWRLPFWPGRRAIPVLVLMGLADGVALMCVLSAAGLPDAQYAAVAASTFGLLTILMAWVLLGERMSALQWLGCLASFAGIGYLAL